MSLNEDISLLIIQAKAEIKYHNYVKKQTFEKIVKLILKSEFSEDNPTLKQKAKK